MAKAVTLLSSKVKMMQSEATRELLKAWCLANGLVSLCISNTTWRRM